MCFSATASFAAAGVLSTVGVVGIIKAGKSNARWYAAIPLLFGIQQAIEGVQWLLVKPSDACTAFGYGFLFFAFLLWPVYIPLSILAMEKTRHLRRWFTTLSLLGGVGSLYLLFWYATSPLTVSVIGNHIDYDIFVPMQWLAIPLYVLCVCSGVCSSRWRVRLMSWLVFAGFLFTIFAYHYTFTSVWCFFAALASAAVILEIYHQAEKKG